MDEDELLDEEESELCFLDEQDVPIMISEWDLESALSTMHPSFASDSCFN